MKSTLTPSIKQDLFDAYWTNPRPIPKDPHIEERDLSVHTFEQLEKALRVAHATSSVFTIWFTYSKGHFNGCCQISK